MWASAVVAGGLSSSGRYSISSIVVACGLSCSEACGIFLDQGPNPHLLHWWGDALPLSHQGSPLTAQIKLNCFGLETPRVVSVSALSPDCYRRPH